MTTGALIFAFNNEQTDYVKMAQWSAERIRHFLQVQLELFELVLDVGRDRRVDKDKQTASIFLGRQFDSADELGQAGRVARLEFKKVFLSWLKRDVGGQGLGQQVVVEWNTR